MITGNILFCECSGALNLRHAVIAAPVVDCFPITAHPVMFHSLINAFWLHVEWKISCMQHVPWVGTLLKISILNVLYVTNSLKQIYANTSRTNTATQPYACKFRTVAFEHDSVYMKTYTIQEWGRVRVSNFSLHLNEIKSSPIMLLLLIKVLTIFFVWI